MPERELAELAEEASRCRACDLWANATQTVFGEGRQSAHTMLVGEQPGNREDLEGLPFVGPAGRLLHEAVTAAGFADDDLYITNAVKHFRWRAVGARRIHQAPAARHVAACAHWLDGEIGALQPRLIVALGLTAATALLRGRVTIGAMRGTVMTGRHEIPVGITVHPSSILRVRDRGERDAALASFTADLSVFRERVSA